MFCCDEFVCCVVCVCIPAYWGQRTTWVVILKNEVYLLQVRVFHWRNSPSRLRWLAVSSRVPPESSTGITSLLHHTGHSHMGSGNWTLFIYWAISPACEIFLIKAHFRVKQRKKKKDRRKGISTVLKQHWAEGRHPGKTALHISTAHHTLPAHDSLSSRCQEIYLKSLASRLSAGRGLLAGTTSWSLTSSPAAQRWVNSHNSLFIFFFFFPKSPELSQCKVMRTGGWMHETWSIFV